MPVLATVLTLASLACLAGAYRFASHGIKLKDNFCVGLACAAVAVAVLLLWLAFRK
jgi:phosphatidylserine synthase